MKILLIKELEGKSEVVTPAEAGLLRRKGAFSSGIFSSSRTLGDSIWGSSLSLFCLLFCCKAFPLLLFLTYLVSLVLPALPSCPSLIAVSPIFWETRQVWWLNQYSPG